MSAITLDEALELSPYGEFNRFSGPKLLDPTVEARGFFGQTFSGQESLPACLRHLHVEIDTCAVHGRIEGPVDGSWTLDRLWQACQSVASTVVDVASGDTEALESSRAVLAAFGLRETQGLARTPEAIGVPTSWMVEFSGSDRAGHDLVATLTMA